eukprot:gene2757-4165_t
MSSNKTEEILISTQFTTSIDHLAEMALDLQRKSMEFKEEIKKEYEHFEEMKMNVKKEQEIMERRGKIDEKVVELNVGGETFTTYLSTLMKAENSMLSAMFSGTFIPGVKDKNGRYFLDRPPKPFNQLLNCLRTGTPLQIPEDELEYQILKEEINFYGLQEYFKKEFEEVELAPMKGCKILSPKEQNILMKWIGSNKKEKWKLCYQATKDGFSASNFRSTCSGKGETITIIKTNLGYIFGGYTPLSWSTTNQYQYNNQSFLFSFKNASNDAPKKLDNNGPHHSNQYSVYQGSSYGPTFGGGHDLYICSNSNTLNQSYSNLGHSYSLPGYTYGTQQIKNYLAGSYNFTISEIEVYSL